jgi:hypothetical protein
MRVTASRMGFAGWVATAVWTMSARGVSPTTPRDPPPAPQRVEPYQGRSVGVTSQSLPLEFTVGNGRLTRIEWSVRFPPRSFEVRLSRSEHGPIDTNLRLVVDMNIYESSMRASRRRWHR